MVHCSQYLAGTLPSATRATTPQQRTIIRMLRELVSSCADEIDVLAYGEFTEECSVGAFRFTIEVDEAPIEDLRYGTLLPILKRKT